MDITSALNVVPGALRRWHPVEKGWSGERKIFVETDTGRYLLRLSDKSQQGAFETIRLAAQTGIHMSQPVAWGQCDAGAYLLLTWVDGEDAETVLPTLPLVQQYRLGLEAGRQLRRLHTLPAPPDCEDWELRFNRKIDRKIAGYQACDLRYEHDGVILEYLAAERHLLRGRPQCFHHGDYHCGNLVIDGDRVGVIDFNRQDYGDPWEEFNRIVWCAGISEPFAAGRVDGYFDGVVPAAFWSLLALYIASNTLSSLYWAIPFGEEEIQTMRRQAANVLRWFDDLRNPVASWYTTGRAAAGIE